MKIYAPTERAARCVKPHKSDAATDSAPSNSNAVAHPIIGEHFFGIEPFRPIGSVAAEIVADLRFRRQVERVHALGPRTVGELPAELGSERGITSIVDQKLDTYAGLDPEAIEATGGDDFWPPPLHEVPR
jgi:hypothetical protein